MELLVRVGLLYVFLTLALRLLGKRELSQLSPFELVTLLLVADTVAPALTAGDRSVTGALAAAAALLCLAWLHSVASYTSRRFRRVVEAQPALLVRHGQLLPEALHRERVRPDEIHSEMHKAGIERLSQVKWAILEPDGQMSFVRFDAADTAGPRPPSAL